MCLGAQAKAANETARRQYKYQLQKREADWMQQLSLTNLERIQYEQGVNASNLGLAEVYGDIQDKHGQLVDQAVQADQESWKQFLQQNTGAAMAASGQTGVSARRIQTLDLAEYLKGTAANARKLSNAAEELNAQGRKAAGQAAAQQKQAWAQQQFVKMPDMPPPQPVMQNVGAAAFMDALSIAGSVAGIGGSIGTMKEAGMFSDRRLKQNIKKIGESISGLSIYTFNYIGKAKKYIGTMSDDVKKLFPEAVAVNDNGYEVVRYDLIDVQFKEVV